MTPQQSLAMAAEQFLGVQRRSMEYSKKPLSSEYMDSSGRNLIYAL